ncbi:MAG: hypothetical protein ACRDJH_13035 [Thermomicrobiales bacterium]
MQGVTSTVLFVCLHGAARSRMAAAFFNAVAADGWLATSAGLDAQDSVSANAVRLLAGSHAEALLDHAPPVPFAAVPTPDRVVAIDCAVPGAVRWNLRHQEVNEAMRDEIRDRAEALARSVSDSGRRA